MTPMRCWMLLLLLGFACGAESTESRDSGGDADSEVEIDYPYPEPDDGLLDRVGTETSLDVASWNIENFPAGDMTAAQVADIIASLGLDLIAVQEVTSVEAFDELVERLRGFDGVLSSHTYGDGSFQKVGFIYKTSVVEVLDQSLLFTNLGFDFPRPPLAIQSSIVSENGERFELNFVVMHLKAGRDTEDYERRTNAVLKLDEYAQEFSQRGEGVVLLGDFNDVVTNIRGREVLSPLLERSQYQFLTEALAEDGEFSFLPSEVLLDHIVLGKSVTSTMASALILDIEDDVEGYESAVSDHRPVIARLPF